MDYSWKELLAPLNAEGGTVHAEPEKKKSILIRKRVPTGKEEEKCSADFEGEKGIGKLKITLAKGLGKQIWDKKRKAPLAVEEENL